MTTILLADNKMCSDTRVTGSVIYDGVQKVFETNNGVYGVAGSLFDNETLVETFEALVKPVVLESGEAVIPATVETSGNLEESSLIYFIKSTGETGIASCDDKGFMRKAKISQPLCIGSGGDLALTAFKCGLSPEDAVKKVFELDPYTGGSVEVVECKRL